MVLAAGVRSPFSGRPATETPLAEAASWAVATTRRVLVQKLARSVYWDLALKTRVELIDVGVLDEVLSPSDWQTIHALTSIRGDDSAVYLDLQD
jgi:hypothetical protein